MARVISGTYADGVTLVSSADNPVRITKSARITAPPTYNGIGQIYGSALVGAGGQPWTIQNAGSIVGPRYAITLSDGGTVDNARSGYLRSTYSAITMGLGSGAVMNAGTIHSDNFDGVYLTKGGYVCNIGTIYGGDYGILAGYSAATITNLGAIDGGYQQGVRLYGGGSVVNGSATDHTASIAGGHGAVYILGQGRVTNWGTLDLVRIYGSGVVANEAGGNIGYLDISTNAGTGTGTVTNRPGAVVTGGVYLDQGTVINEGSVLGLGISLDISSRFRQSSLIVNGSAENHAASVVGGIYDGSRGTIFNFGTVTGGFSSGIGSFDGYIRNAAGAAVIAAGGISLYGFAPAQASLSNAGIVVGTAGPGVYLRSRYGSSIYNGAQGLIIGSGAATSQPFGIQAVSDGSTGVTATTVVNRGIVEGTTGISFAAGPGVAYGVAGTVVNSGTVIGTGGVAVAFGTGASRLVVEPGAVFIGAVVGGSGSNALELRGAGGSLDGLGSSFVNFSTVRLDAGARWSVTGVNTLLGGSIGLAPASALLIDGALSDPGNLTLSGSGAVGVARTGSVQLGGAGSTVHGAWLIDAGGSLVGSGTVAGLVIDNGALVASGGALNLSGEVFGHGSVQIAANSEALAQSALCVDRVRFLGGSNAILGLAEPALMHATIEGFGPSDAIDLLRTHVTGLVFQDHALHISEAGGAMLSLKFAGHYAVNAFGFAPDHHGGSFVFLR